MSTGESSPAPLAGAGRPPTKAPRRRRAAVRLGFVPLLDAAPLIVAEALGWFREAGLALRLTREPSWDSVREKMTHGKLDAAHSPGGLLLSLLLGAEGPPIAVRTDLLLSLGGNAITLSRRLWEDGVRGGAGLRRWLERDADRKLVLAVPSAYSSHTYILRTWLDRNGIKPEASVQIVTLPPPKVQEHLRAGRIDGFCVGEPWNSAAAAAGDGFIIATSAKVFPRHPEKVLLVADAFIRERAEEYKKLRSVLLRACRFCEAKENRGQIVALLMESKLFPVAQTVLESALLAPPKSAQRPTLSFLGADENFTSGETVAWFLRSSVAAGVITPEAAQRVFCQTAFTMPEPD